MKYKIYTLLCSFAFSVGILGAQTFAQNSDLVQLTTTHKLTYLDQEARRLYIFEPSNNSQTMKVIDLQADAMVISLPSSELTTIERPNYKKILKGLGRQQKLLKLKEETITPEQVEKSQAMMEANFNAYYGAFIGEPILNITMVPKEELVGKIILISSKMVETDSFKPFSSAALEGFSAVDASSSKTAQETTKPGAIIFLPR